MDGRLLRYLAASVTPYCRACTNKVLYPVGYSTAAGQTTSRLEVRSSPYRPIIDSDGARKPRPPPAVSLESRWRKTAGPASVLILDQGRSPKTSMQLSSLFGPVLVSSSSGSGCSLSSESLELRRQTIRYSWYPYDAMIAPMMVLR